jgi:site-specific DNA recombinase
MQTKRAVIYARTATLTSAKPSVLDRQTKAAKAILLKNGWELISIYQDVGSGLRVDHPGLQQMIDDAHQGLFDVVVVSDFSRVTRSVTEFQSIVRDLEAQGIDLYSDTRKFSLN